MAFEYNFIVKDNDSLTTKAASGSEAAADI